MPWSNLCFILMFKVLNLNFTKEFKSVFKILFWTVIYNIFLRLLYPTGTFLPSGSIHCLFETEFVPNNHFSLPLFAFNSNCTKSSLKEDVTSYRCCVLRILAYNKHVTESSWHITWKLIKWVFSNNDKCCQETPFGDILTIVHLQLLWII